MRDNTYTIYLHGSLKELFPEPFTLRASNIAEAFRGFCSQTKALNVPAGADRHEICIAGINREDQLYDTSGVITEIHVTPALYGGGRGGGFFRIILGVALIGLAIAFPAGIGAAGSMFFMSSSSMFWMGASMILGGLLSFFSPSPEADRGGFSISTSREQNPEASKYLGAPRNTVKLGTRIPILYGRFRVYGHYLSFDIDAVDVNPNTGDPLPEWEADSGDVAGEATITATTEESPHVAPRVADNTTDNYWQSTAQPEVVTVVTGSSQVYVTPDPIYKTYETHDEGGGNVVTEVEQPPSYWTTVNTYADEERNPQTLHFDYGVGNEKTIVRYVVATVPGDVLPDNARGAPKSWRLEASNNNTDWTGLDTQTDELNNKTDPINGKPFGEYSFSNTTAYRYYRIVFTEGHGDTNYIVVGEVEMMES